MALCSTSPILSTGVLLLAMVQSGCGENPGTSAVSEVAADSSVSRLAVLWTSGDPEVAENVAFMYTLNARTQGWFDEVTLIVWGPSAALLASDARLQALVREMGDAGVVLLACKACADRYGVAPQLEALGIEVKYMGQPLTEILKGDWKMLTF